MNPKGEALCAWAGPACVILFGIGWIVCAGWIPVPPPSLSPTEIAGVYQENTFGIRFGMMLIMYCGALNAPFTAIIAIYMLRMKGPTPAFAYTQLGMGAVNTLFFIIPAQFFGAVAYRPDRMPEITQFGNDLSWILFDMANSTTIIEWLAIGFAILWDKSVNPVFPRWFGYYHFWSALLVIPASLITYFKTGPFAWAGALGFYLGVIVFFFWYFVMFVMLMKAIRERAGRPASAAEGILVG